MAGRNGHPFLPVRVVIVCYAPIIATRMTRAGPRRHHTIRTVNHRVFEVAGVICTLTVTAMLPPPPPPRWSSSRHHRLTRSRSGQNGQ